MTKMLLINKAKGRKSFMPDAMLEVGLWAHYWWWELPQCNSH